MSIVEVCSLNVTIRKKLILKNVSMTIGSGVTMLLGKNGSGKSTLIKAMLGLVRYTGVIRVEGKDVHTLSAAKRARIFSYLPQVQNTPSGISLSDYVAASTSGPFSSPDEAGRNIALAELSRVGLIANSAQKINTLSGGELRLAGLARARAQKSSIMLLDEPLAGLDIARQHEFLRQTCSDNSPILMSIHDPALAWQYADKILFMHDGCIYEILPGNEQEFERLLSQAYGPHIRFEQAGNSLLPIWHID